MIGNRPILLTASLSMAAILAMTMVAAPVLADTLPAYTTVNSGTVTLTVAKHNEMLSFNVVANGAIPKQADQFITDNKVFGYAWLGSGGQDVPFVAATIHTGVLDSIQNPNGWHLHSGTLTANAECSAYSGLSVATLTDPTGAGLTIKGSSLTASVSEDKVVVNEANFAHTTAAFTLVPQTDGTLCVNVISGA